jgi:hypothetical protein
MKMPASFQFDRTRERLFVRLIAVNFVNFGSLR